MTRREVLCILGVNPEDLKHRAIEFIGPYLDDEICVTDPDDRKLPSTKTLEIVGWQSAEGGTPFAIRVARRNEA